jgi:hypothetical protein
MATFASRFREQQATAQPAVPGGDWWMQNGYTDQPTAQPAIPSPMQPMQQQPAAAPMQPTVTNAQFGTATYPLASVTGEGFMRPWTESFKPPDLNETTDPGYNFRLKEGQQAIERSAAAKGTLLTPQALKAITRWGQDYASNEYDKVYGRAMGEYRTAHDIYKGNQADQFNRTSSIAGIGQTAANQLGATGTSYAGQGSDLITGAGNAGAAGRIGSANAWNQGLQGITDAATLYAILQRQGQPMISY